MKCSYCLSEVKKGTGIMFVSRIGNVSYFCSSRCYKNGAVMHRKERRMHALQDAKMRAKQAAAPKAQ
jgi:large subunit ribosomal protein L24e